MKRKNKVVAGLLSFFLGGIGVHKFYLGKVGWGITYLLFSLTSIPMFLGMIEGLIFILMSDKSFQEKYS
jgi:TM2 domain-containing membrane protein YozV